MVAAIVGGEEPIEMLRVQARARIAHGDPDTLRAIRLGPHYDLARTVADATQGFDGVDEDIQQDLLYLDAVGTHQRHRLGEVRRNHDPVALHFAARQRQDVPDRVVDVEPVLVGGGFLGEGVDPGDDGAGTLAVATTRTADCWARSRFCAASQRTQALALLTMAPSG